MKAEFEGADNYIMYDLGKELSLEEKVQTNKLPLIASALYLNN